MNIRGNVNIWDHLEITTGYNRGICKKIGICIAMDKDLSNIKVAEATHCHHSEVWQVRHQLNKWVDWVENRSCNHIGT